MARNLEIKVRCTPQELRLMRTLSEKMGGGHFEQLHQIDTYFSVTHGRLKLREIFPGGGDATAELIAYRRANESASRWSDYQRVDVPLERAEELKSALGISCGVSVVVTKDRKVGTLRRTRIHLDEVESLGAFVELETVAGEHDLDEDIESEHASIIQLLGLRALPVIAGSYSDLIKALPRGSK